MKKCPNCGELIGDNVSECVKDHMKFMIYWCFYL